MTGRINPQKESKKILWKAKKTYKVQTEGMDSSELSRRKAAGECQRCAWPTDRKGAHKTTECFRWKRVEKGTTPFPKKQVD